MANLANFKHFLSILESKKLLHLNFSISFIGDGSADLYIDHSAASDYMTELKRLFGPFKAVESYSTDSKNLRGTLILEDYEVTLTINHAYTCTPVDPSTTTEEEWDSIISQIKEGVIKVSTCRPVERD